MYKGEIYEMDAIKGTTQRNATSAGVGAPGRADDRVGTFDLRPPRKDHVWRVRGKRERATTTTIVIPIAVDDINLI